MIDQPIEAGAVLAGLCRLESGHGREPLAPEYTGERLIELAETAEQQALGDLGLALAAAPIIVRLADGLRHIRAQVRARRAQAQALAYASRFDEAMRVLADASALADSGIDGVEVGRLYMTRLHILARQGRYTEALRDGRRARRAFKAAGAPMLAAKADANLAVTLRMKGDPARALRHFERARPHMLGDPLSLAQLDSNRAEALLDTGQFAQAEQAFRAALAAFDEFGVAGAAAIVEGNIGDLMSRQGRLHDALYHFERARRRLEDGESPGELARLIAEQADAFAAAGLFDEAKQSYDEAIPVLRSHRRVQECARALTGLGRTLTLLGRHESALARLDEAEALFVELGHVAGRGHVLTLKGDLEIRRNRSTAAWHHITRALTMLRDHPAEVAGAQLLLAELHLDRGELLGAESLFAEAITEARRMSMMPRLVELLHGRARLRREQRRPSEAVDDLREALDHVERLRSRMRSDRLRSVLLRNYVGVHEELIDLLLERGGVAATREAFVTMERARSRSLLDLVGGAVELVDHLRHRASDEAEARLLDDLLAVHGELAALHGRHETLSSTGEPAAPSVPARNRLEALEDRMRVLESRLESTRGAGGFLAPPPDGAAVQSMLAPDSVIVEYYQVAGRMIAFVVRHDGLEAVDLLLTASELCEAADQFRFQIGRSLSRIVRGREVGSDLTADACHELRRLHDALIAPLGAALTGIERLVIVPHGPLHTVPFAALHDGTHHLVERFQVSHAPSASLLWHLDRRPRAKSLHPALVAGVDDRDAPRIRDEIAAVRSSVRRATFVEGDAATLARVTEAAGACRLLHLACHGRFLERYPLSAGVRLADGWLTTRDVLGLRLESASVVLSGCDTGGADVHAGEELLGLSWAFLAAGAESLVTSLWTVSDRTTAELMATFYELWHGSGGGRDAPSTPVSAALCRAQRSLLQRHRHPVFWAPFVVMGRP